MHPLGWPHQILWSVAILKRCASLSPPAAYNRLGTCHVKILWELLCVSSDHLGRLPLWAPFNQVDVVFLNKYFHRWKGIRENPFKLGALGLCRKPETECTDFDILRKSLAFRGRITTLAFCGRALLRDSRMCLCYLYCLGIGQGKQNRGKVSAESN